MERITYARFAFVAVFAIVAYYVFRIIQPFLVALIWAAILATVFYPLYDSFSRRWKRPEIAGVLACVLITVAIILPVIVLLVLLAGESVEAYRYFQDKLRTGNLPSLESLTQSAAYEWLRGKLIMLGLPEPDLRTVALKAIEAVSQFLVRHSSSVFSRFAAFIFNFVITLVGTYYLFLSGPAMMEELRRLSPLRKEHEDKIIAKFIEITRATFEGNLMTALLQGMAGGLVFLGFGLPSPLLWGAVMTFLSLVPLVGTALVWGPVVIYYLLTGHEVRAGLLFVLCAVVVGSIDNLIKPLLIRRRAQIPTLWVFVGVMGGVSAFGFLGFVLGPLMIAVLFTLLEIYKVEFSDELSQKQAS
jgi:predicted PurR-regulated permease PerM